jgi:two-component sensor histidine kinase
MTAEPAAATRYACTYPGHADQVRHVRRAVASHLAGCPVANDAVLIASELASNAILHSRSRTEQFTIRAEMHPDHVLIEAEDLGGPWRRRTSDGRPHGLTVVEALTGPDGWGVKTTSESGRVVWARLDLETAGSETPAMHASRTVP